MLILSFLVSDVSESLRLLTKIERCERIPEVTHQKKMSDHERFANGRSEEMSEIRSKSLRSLTINERMSEYSFFLANCSFAHFWAKNERFAWKTDERIPSPESKQTIFAQTSNIKQIQYPSDKNDI